MRASRKNDLIFILLTCLCILPSCTTSSYRVIAQEGYRAELQVTPDRILIECEDIKDHENAGDPEGNFGFMIHVLDENNSVLTLIQGPVTTRAFCLEQQREVGKIIKNGKSIYVAGHGDLSEPRKVEKLTYSSFPKSGVFYGNGRILTYSVIKNEHGQCYSLHNGTNAPCMPPEFPIRSSPRR